GELHLQHRPDGREPQRGDPRRGLHPRPARRAPVLPVPEVLHRLRHRCRREGVIRPSAPPRPQPPTGRPSLSASPRPLMQRNPMTTTSLFGDARFPLGPFTPYENNPILRPKGDSWESSNLYNPAALVVDDRVVLLYRAHA